MLFISFFLIAEIVVEIGLDENPIRFVVFEESNKWKSWLFISGFELLLSHKAQYPEPTETEMSTANDRNDVETVNTTTTSTKDTPRQTSATQQMQSDKAVNNEKVISFKSKLPKQQLVALELPVSSNSNFSTVVNALGGIGKIAKVERQS